MNVIDHLNEINTAFEGVQIVAYTDLSSQMVLGNVTKKKIGQEHLDALCKQAVAAFDDPLLSLADTNPDSPNDAIILGLDGIMVCLCSASDPDDALICQCDDSVDVEILLSVCRNVLTEIGAA